MKKILLLLLLCVCFVFTGCNNLGGVGLHQYSDGTVVEYYFIPFDAQEMVTYANISQLEIIQMRTNMCDPICTEVMLVYYINKQNSFDICKNLALIGKELRNNIKMLSSVKMTSSSSNTTYGPRYYGDGYCTKDVDCLSELTLDDIYEQCEYCTDSNAHCSYYFRFDMI